MRLVFLEIDHGSDRYRETLAIRDWILRKPLGLHFDESEIAAEAVDHHLVATDPESGEIVACLVLSPVDSQRVHMRQVAVIETRRGSGIGTAMIHFAERFACNRKFSIMKLHARETVVPFYERLGYRTVGEPFIEVSIPHLEMRKSLDSLKQKRPPAVSRGS